MTPGKGKEEGEEHRKTGLPGHHKVLLLGVEVDNVWQVN